MGSDGSLGVWWALVHFLTSGSVFFFYLSFLTGAFFFDDYRFFLFS